MKSIKSLALIVVGAIALLPSVSFAQNVSGNSQETNLNSVTLGDGNINVTETEQKILNLQTGGTNIGGTTQSINGHTTTVGNGNIDIKKAIQEAIGGQQSPGGQAAVH